MASMIRGRFITVEGGEGAGKSTQLRLLAERLRERGADLLLTREPGGTEGAEAIRGLIVDGPAERWRPLAELYLFLAAREDHLHRAILPALAEGRWVLCDRFADSSRVYQGIAGELGLDLVDRLQDPLLGAHRPDLTLVLDLPVATGLARCAARGGAARFEAKGTAYHERVREGFRLLAAREPERFAVVDADRPEDEVAGAIWRTVLERLDPGRP
jgi:dTMP kinase